MAETTGISWCDRTWSPWIGCTKVSPACDGCYAAHLMDTRLGRVEWGPHGERNRTAKAYWRKLQLWDGEAHAAGRRFTVFPSLCDPFDNAASPADRIDFFRAMGSTPNLVYLLLTKRPQNIVRMARDAGGLPANAALGVTCEDRKRTEINLSALREAADELHPVLFTFASFEPLLEDVGDLTPWLYGPVPLGWAITGGETDQGAHRARPSHPSWFHSIRDQCRRASVPYHHKQNGEWQSGITARDGEPGRFALHWAESPGRWAYLDYGPRQFAMFGADARMTRVGKKAAGRLLDGVEHNGFPEVRHG